MVTSQSALVHGPAAATIRAWQRHAIAAVCFAALSIVLTWPLAARVATHVPGTAADDNLVFLWNFWWMRQALADGLAGFFHTPYLFHPYGVSLLLHTHSALSAFVGATVLGDLPHQTALNLTIIASCGLNGWSAYLLAYRASVHWRGSLLAGMFFAAHPAVAKNLLGHFSLYSAWSVGLFAYALFEALDRRGRWWPPIAGALLAAVAYVDYYYFVYACVLILVVAAYRRLHPSGVKSAWIPTSRLDGVLACIAIGLALVAFTVWWTGGFVAEVGGVRVSMTTGTNLRAAAALAGVVWLWRRWRPRLTVAPERAGLAADVRVLATMAAVCALLVTPLIVAAVEMWRSGQYVSQTYFWRSAPAGVDPGTLLLGNPFNALWGAAVMRWYEAAGIFPFDGPLWSGAAAIVLLMTHRAWRRRPQAGVWLAIGAVFLVWSLGPYFQLFGMNTGLPLPGILLRYVPLVSNARLPARAVVLVCLAAAVLLAMAIAHSRRLQRAPALALLAALVAVDFWAAPIPMHRLDRAAIYDLLATLPEGAVLEVPLGIRDGFGESGRIDTSVLYYQSVHGKPLAGGYVSRLPPEVRRAYEEDPVFGALLRLSAGAPDDGAISGQQVRNALARAGIRYVVIDRALASPAVVQLVLSMPVTRLAGDAGRELYEIR